MSTNVTPDPTTDPATDPIADAAARVLAERGLQSGEACGTGGSCDDCTDGCDDHDGATACGNDGGVASAEERLTLAASGLVIALVAAAIVGTGGTVWHWTLAAVAVAGGLALGILGTIASLKGGVLGDRLLRRGATLLPYVTGVLFLGIIVRVVTTVLRLF